LRRVHRTFSERLLYAAMYECGQCHTRKPEPRWYALHLGDYPRCPHCGTYRLTRMATRDKIDPMHKGPVNFAQYLLGADLYHCRYCRVQFYDVRKPVAPEIREKATAAAPVAAAQGSAEG
jgi:DNA-directed RNA polymerase subunit RPC12/RpoP